MKFEITYIFHNCFVLKVQEKTFLFDYPADEYLNDSMRAVIQAKITGSDLYVFSSHNHKDHFNRNVARLSAVTRQITYFLAKDIIKRNREYRDLPGSYNIAPDQTYTIAGLGISSFLSNDEGVAFLITTGQTNIYFGGDLANWSWDGLTKQEHRFLVDYFGEVLEKLQQWPVQIAFSNTDPRLQNWSGAAQFIKTIKPNIFVPMHTFGDTDSLGRFLKENPQPENRFFRYQKTGDTMLLDLPFED